MADTDSRLTKVRRVVVSVFLALVGWLLCAGGVDASSPALGAALFAAGCAVLLLGLRRHPGIALLLAALATSVQGDTGTFTIWNAVFLVLGTLGAGLLLGLRSRYSLLLMSIPWWLLAFAAKWIEWVALGLTLLWMASLLRPFISGRRRLHVEPNPRLARGPLVEVTPRTFGFTRGRSVVRVLALLATLGCAVGLAVWALAIVMEGLAAQVGEGITILFASFAVALWIADITNREMRFRVDQTGVHAHRVVGETSIRWSEVGQLNGKGMLLAGTTGFVHTYDFFCILGGDREIAFSGSMPGADELVATVEAATGMSWTAAVDGADASSSSE